MIKQIQKSCIALGIVLCSCLTLAGQTIERMDSIPVTEGGVTLQSPFAGGLNLPQFSRIDLNADGVEDLFIFDRDGNVMMPYLNIGTNTAPDFEFAPEFVSDFPNANGWALLRDFDGDGQPDLIAGNDTDEGVVVYWNTRTSTGPPVFVQRTNRLQSNYGLITKDLFVSSYDVPGVVDTDGDGDMDILTFNTAGIHIELHQNLSQELYGHSDSLVYEVMDPCWGKFREDGLNNTITLGISCKGITAPVDIQQGAAHAGSSICPLDEDADGDMEVLIGDLTHENLVYVRNAGTASLADMDSTNYSFPSYSMPVWMDVFPAAFYEDVTGDGRKDLLVAPNLAQVSENFESVWMFEDTSAVDSVRFALRDRSFLQDEMIDCGRGSKPVLFDHNGDGLMDIVVANDNYKYGNVNYSGLTLYENVGTVTQPAFELITRDYASLTTVFNPMLSAISLAFGDLDNDGDEDMLLGDSNGLLHLMENTATAGNPASFTLTQYNFKAIDIGGYSAPFIADLDGDGKKDLVVGEMAGNLNLFMNIGTATVPDFPSSADDINWGKVDTNPECCTGYSIPFLFQDSTGTWEMIVGAENGNLYHFTGISSMVGDSFPMQDSLYGQIIQGEHTAIYGGDLNNDQKRDWVVGNERGGLGVYGDRGFVSREKLAPLQQLVVAPNPFGSYLNIRLPEALKDANGRLTVLDLQGRVVQERIWPQGKRELKLDSDALPRGVYHLRLVTSEGEIALAKVVRQ